MVRASAFGFREDSFRSDGERSNSNGDEKKVCRKNKKGPMSRPFS